MATAAGWSGAVLSAAAQVEGNPFTIDGEQVHPPTRTAHCASPRGVRVLRLTDPFDGAQFHIRLYPGGHLEKDKGCVSAFLMYTGHRDGVRAVFTFVATHSGLPRCELL